MTGSVIVLVLLGVGIFKCVSIMRRPATSTLCVLALLLLLLGWGLSSTASTLKQLVAAFDGAFLIISSLLACIIFLAALILAIIGLAAYDKNRFNQGRAQAIWTIVLSGLFLLSVGGMAGNQIFLALRKGVPAGNQAPAGTPIENREFNFSVTPQPGWTQLKPKAVNQDACLALQQRLPENFCMVIGERHAGTVDSEQVREASKSNLAGAAKVLEQSEDSVTVNGITYARFNTRAKVPETILPVEYEHWITVNRGFSWQVIFWSTGSRQQLSKEARKLMETFRILDPNLEGNSEGNAKDVDRPQLGYRTKLEGMGWRAWDDADGNALTDFRAQRSTEALQVSPVLFDREPPDMEALTPALLSTMGFDEIPLEDFQTRPWSPAHGGTGLELEIDQEVNGIEFHYLIRIARGERHAHLLAGWSTVAKGDAGLVRRSMDAITLSPPKGNAPKFKSAQKKALGLVMNEAGLAFFRRHEPETAATWFYEGFKLGNDPTLLSNAADAFERSEQAAKGRETLAPHIGNFRSHHQLALKYARLQALSGDVEGGVDTVLRQIENGLKNEDDLLPWLQWLNTHEHYPAALRCIDAWLKRHSSCNSRRWQCQIYASSGDSRKAVELLEPLHKEFPNDRKVTADLGNAYNEAGDHEKAATLAESLLADGKEPIAALKILGWSQMGRKWYRDAKATFERAAKVQPDDEEIQNAIRRASALLGEGDNSSVKTPIEPVALPKEVTAAFEEKPAAESFGDGYPSAWLMKATGYHFEKGKPIRKTIHRRVKILTAEGAREFSSVEMKFEPLAERIFMNRFEVRDAAGKVIASASPNDAYVRDSDNDVASTEKVLHMQVAGVKPGTTLEWVVTTEELSPSNAFEFQRQPFASSIPAAGEAVFVTGDLTALRAEVAQGDTLKTIRTKQLAAWISGEQAAAAFESYSIPLERRCPMLWLGAAGDSWEKVGAGYLKDIEDRIKVDKPVQDLAASLIAGKTTEREKIAAIARYVQKGISYKAIEFGIRARRPNAASEVLHLRYGDCKDTALLTHLLLRAAGITSHLALVNTNWHIQSALPNLDQFNHLVVAVPALGPNWLLDATDKSLALASFPADNLWHSGALLLDPAKPRLIEVPGHATPDALQINSRRTVTLEGRDWKVNEALDLTGYSASWMRGAFSGLNPTEQHNKAQSILSSQGTAQLQEFKFENLDDVENPARLIMTYTIPGGVSASAGHLTGSLPALWERSYLGTQFVKDRKTPFEMLYPIRISSVVTLKLSSSPAKESIAALTQKAQSPYGSWQLKPEAKDGNLIVHLDFTAKPGSHPASAYATFHEAWEAARRAWDKPLNWPES